MSADNQRVAEKLLAIAQRDLQAATALFSSSPALTEQIGFHCQHAVEKSIKAVLAFNSINYPYTHNLAQLNLLAETQNVSLPDAFVQSEALTPFAMSVRYDGLDAIDDEIDMPKLLASTKTCVDFAQSYITQS